MEAKGSSGQFLAYNTYATPPATNPLFPGFSRSQRDNFKKQQTPKPMCFRGFLYEKQSGQNDFRLGWILQNNRAII